MNISLNEEETKRIISMYYTEVKNTDVQVNINLSSISVITHIDFVGNSFKSEERLSNQELCEIVDHFLGDEYILKRVHMIRRESNYPSGNFTYIGGLDVNFDRVKQKALTR